MRKLGAPIALALAVLSGGCESRSGASQEGGQRTGEASLVGDWSASEPLEEQQDGITMRISAMRTTYFRDNTSNFEADLRVTGPGLPAGLDFRMAGDGTWLRQGDVLRESIGNVSIRPRQNDPAMQQMAASMEQELERQPSTNSDILELTGDRLRVRSRETGKIITMTR